MKAPCSLAVVCLCLALPGLPQQAAASPAEELLRFVPPDVSFCLVLRDLRGHAAALRDSPFAEGLRRSPFGLLLRTSPELKQLELAEQFLEKQLGISLDRLRDDVLGDAIVFAYRPGPPGKMEQEQGLVLLRARAAQPLADLVDRMNRMLREGGVLKEMSEKEHGGFKYVRRVEGQEENFLHLRGPILIYSGQEAMLRESLTLEKKTPVADRSPIGRSLEQLGASQSFAALWVNPRSFDAELDRRWKNTASVDEKAFLGTFRACWKALDATVFTLGLTKDLELGLTVRGRPEALPRPVRRFLDDAAVPSDLWSRFSDDALLALAARTPARTLLTFLGAFQSKEALEQMQDDLTRGLAAALGKRDLMNDVLPHIGPDWGLSVVAPSPGEKGWFPSMLFALRVAAGNGTPAIDRTLIRQLDAFATLAVFGFNKMRKDPLVRSELTEKGLEIYYFGSGTGEAMGLQPAFGLCDGYLVIASTPETFRRFATMTPSKSKPGETPLVRVSLKHLREYLKDRKQALTATLSEQHRLPAPQVGKHLDDLSEGLGFFDRLELTQKTASGQVGFTLRLRPTQPLRK